MRFAGDNCLILFPHSTPIVSASRGKEAPPKASKADRSAVSAIDYTDIPLSQIRKVSFGFSVLEFVYILSVFVFFNHYLHFLTNWLDP